MLIKADQDSGGEFYCSNALFGSKTDVFIALAAAIAIKACTNYYLHKGLTEEIYDYCN